MQYASNIVSVTPGAPPSVVLTAVAGNNRVDLSWNNLPGNTQTIVKRSTDGFTFEVIATLGAEVYGYQDFGSLSAPPTNGTTYFYIITVTAN
jgi:hypothetical protein